MIRIARSTTRTRSGCTPCSRSRDSLLRQKAIRRYPIRKVTTPVPVEGGVAGGALPKSAGTSFHGRRKPNGSACQRRTMAGVQEEAKHAIERDVAVEVLRRREAPAPAVDAEQALVLVVAAVLEAGEKPSTYS